MKKIISSLVVVGSFMVSSGASALDLAYVTGQYGSLTVASDIKTKNIGVTLGFSVLENLFIEGQVSINLSEYEESESEYLGSTGTLDNPNERWGMHKDSYSAQFFGAFAVYKIEKESIYGKARIGLASVDLDWDHSRDLFEGGVDSRSKSFSDTGLSFGIGGGISVGPGAVEFEYTKLPDVEDEGVKYISLGYVYPF